MSLHRGLLQYLDWVSRPLRADTPGITYGRLKPYHFLTWVLIAVVSAPLHPRLWTTERHTGGQPSRDPRLTSSGDEPYGYYRVSTAAVWSIVRQEVASFFLGLDLTPDGKFPGTTWLQMHPVNGSDDREEPSPGEGNFSLFHRRFSLRECLELVDRLENSSHVRNHTRVIFITKVHVLPEVALFVSRLNLTHWSQGDRPPFWLLSHSVQFADFAYEEVVKALVCVSFVLHCFCCVFEFASTDRLGYRRFININIIFNLLIFYFLYVMTSAYLDFTSFRTRTFNKRDMSFQLISGKRVADTASIISDTNFHIWKKFRKPVLEEDKDNPLLDDVSDKFDEVFDLGVNVEEQAKENDTDGQEDPHKRSPVDYFDNDYDSFEGPESLDDDHRDNERHPRDYHDYYEYQSPPNDSYDYREIQGRRRGGPRSRKKLERRLPDLPRGHDEFEHRRFGPPGSRRRGPESRRLGSPQEPHLHGVPELHEKSETISNSTRVARQTEELLRIFKAFRHGAAIVVALCGGKITYEIMYRSWIIKLMFVGAFCIFAPAAFFVNLAGSNGDMTFWQSVHNAFGQVSQISPGFDNPSAWILVALLCLLIRYTLPHYHSISDRTIYSD